MEKIKEYRVIFLIALVVLGFSFYWFQLRPTSIKKDCSWVTQVERGRPAVPASPGVTKAEADKAKLDAEKKCVDENIKLCFYVPVVEQPPQEARPAESDREITREATRSEYDRCLRNNGL